MNSKIEDYVEKLMAAVSEGPWKNVKELAQSLLSAWVNKSQVFLCGNGGSAANAAHLANDFLYGVASHGGSGLRVEALSANSAVLTCLANDVGYDEIFSYQLATKANAGDLLIALSGSGNSPNIVQAVKAADHLNMTTFAILGFDGGECLNLAHNAIHFPVQDMQVAEDLQLITGHMCMQWLVASKVGESLSEAKS